MEIRKKEGLEERLAGVLDRIESGVQTREEVFSVIYALMEKGRSVPPRLELCSLKYLLEDDPQQKSVKQRMVAVYNLLGEVPSEELAQELVADYIQEEHATNHQQVLQEYAAKVGCKDLDPAFFPLLGAVRAYTMTSAERLYALWSCVRYLHGRGREGDFMEVGVWRGGSMMLAAMTLRQLGGKRHLWLYDTFSGLPRPDEALDTDILNNRAIDGWLPRSFDGRTSAWAYADEREVRENMRKTGYPDELLHFVAGKVEDTIPGTLPEKIALLRIDTDFYSSYRHTLEHAYDRLVPGGICILDDYGHFCGARKAVDDFLEQRQLCVLMHRPDYSCRVFVKEL